MSLLEEAKMVEVTKRYLKAPREELLELACAYLRHEVSCTQITKALQKYGYKGSGGNGQQIVSNMIMGELRSGRYKFVKA
jgi:hypothetical protein